MGEQGAEQYRLVTLGRMLAGVAHEIATPVGSLASNNEVLRHSLEALRRQPLPEKAAQIVASLAEVAEVDRVAAERIAGLVQSVKRMARADGGEPVEADLNELLRDSLKLVAHQYRRRVTVEAELGALPRVACHPQQLGQVFVNLLVNAGQAIDGEGTVTVRTRLQDGVAEVTISDTGRGIDPAHRDRIFSAGFTTKPPGAGTGLGLAISRQIVEAHGGAITFESRPGGGTTFSIRIPVQRGA